MLHTPIAHRLLAMGALAVSRRRRRPGVGGPGGGGTEPPKSVPGKGEITGQLDETSAIVAAEPAGALAHPLVKRAGEYAADARSAETKRAYQGDWRRFVTFCKQEGFSPLPPDPKVRCAFASWMADGGTRGRPYPLTTIRRHLSSVAVASKALGHPFPQSDPDVADVLKGIARRVGDRPKKKRALLAQMLPEILAGLQGLPLMVSRNRCLLSLGLFFAQRRSQLVGADIEHVEATDEPREPGRIGLRIFVPRSKTDPTGKGRWVGIPYARNADVCPVRLTEAWIAALSEHGVASGPLLRHVDQVGRLVAGRLDGGSISRVIKRILKAQGYDPREFAGHSLRRGFVTSAVRAKKTWDAICRTTGHSTKSVRMMLEYTEDAAVLDGDQNAGAGLV